MTRQESIRKMFYEWAKQKFPDTPLSFSDVGLMLDSFKAGYSAKRSAEADSLKDDALDFVIQYLYSEHQICDPEDDAAPYTPDELKEMAIKILKNR